MRNNNLDEQYLTIAEKILERKKLKKTRNGDVYSSFSWSMRHNMKEGFPILTSKKVSLKTVFTELKWFMLGRTDLRYLLERKCYIWVGDAHKNYMRNVNSYISDAYKDLKTWRYLNLDEDDYHLTPWEYILNKGHVKDDETEQTMFIFLTEDEFREKIIADDEFNEAYGDLGPIYGAQWRNFGGDPITYSQLAEDTMGKPDEGGVHTSRFRGTDQISMILDLLKNDPDSRRIRGTAWNPNVLNRIALPSCHTDFQFYTEENDKGGRDISLEFKCRSQDLFLGTPFNTSSYGIFLKTIAAIMKYEACELIHLMGDTHIYLPHLDAITTQLGNQGHKLPELVLKGEFDKVDDYWVDGVFQWDNFINKLEWEKDFELVGYEHDGVIKAPLLT